MNHLVKTQTLSFILPDTICKIPKFSGLVFFAVINLGRAFIWSIINEEAYYWKWGRGKFKSINFLNAL